MGRFSDIFTYAVLLAIIILYVMGKSETNPDVQTSPPIPSEQTPSKPEEPSGAELPNITPSDPTILVEVPAPTSSIGTAFAIDNQGTWLTARHVVDSCDQVALKMSSGKYVKVNVEKISTESDTALLVSKWKRPALARDFYTRRQIDERGFFLGFPQGKPGEATGKLVGRRRMVVKGRYRSSEAILAWAETGRSSGLDGSLGGLSGGPTFDTDGEIIGVVTAESMRRGRIYTVAPKTLANLISPLEKSVEADPITLKNYGRRGAMYRRNKRIAQVVCLVK